MTTGDDATAWPWRSSFGSGPSASDPAQERPDLSVRSLPEEFYARPSDVLARDLLGCLVVSDIGGRRTAGVIVETEAYVGPEDPASHARASVGRTRRNASMFGPPGIAYVYRSYGIHWCMNVVAGAVDDPVAVLLRALDPVQGTDLMIERRGRSTHLCAGPGRLTQALGVTGEMDGHDLSEEPLRLFDGWKVADDAVGVSGRIGIRRAVDWPLRFYLRNHPSVSRSPSR